LFHASGLPCPACNRRLDFQIAHDEDEYNPVQNG